jgi:hypothetical protein
MRELEKKILEFRYAHDLPKQLGLPMIEDQLSLDVGSLMPVSDEEFGGRGGLVAGIRIHESPRTEANPRESQFIIDVDPQRQVLPYLNRFLSEPEDNWSSGLGHMQWMAGWLLDHNTGYKDLKFNFMPPKDGGPAVIQNEEGELVFRAQVTAKGERISIDKAYEIEMPFDFFVERRQVLQNRPHRFLPWIDVKEIRIKSPDGKWLEASEDRPQFHQDGFFQYLLRIDPPAFFLEQPEDQGQNWWE